MKRYLVISVVLCVCLIRMANGNPLDLAVEKYQETEFDTDKFQKYKEVVHIGWCGLHGPTYEYIPAAKFYNDFICSNTPYCFPSSYEWFDSSITTMSKVFDFFSRNYSTDLDESIELIYALMTLEVFLKYQNNEVSLSKLKGEFARLETCIKMEELFSTNRGQRYLGAFVFDKLKFLEMVNLFVNQASQQGDPAAPLVFLGAMNIDTDQVSYNWRSIITREVDCRFPPKLRNNSFKRGLRNKRIYPYSLLKKDKVKKLITEFEKKHGKRHRYIYLDVLEKIYEDFKPSKRDTKLRNSFYHDLPYMVGDFND